MNKKIVLFDPSLKNHQSEFSDNFGDIIIFESVKSILMEIFPDSEIIRIPTHCSLRKIDYSLLKEANFVFMGGSNLLSSHLLKYNQWKISNIPSYLIHSELNNIILLGVGWWQYQEDPDFLTKKFYKKTFTSKYKNSVRDLYTKNILIKAGIDNVLNTSCPTVWGINGFDGNRKNKNTSVCLLTLTDYKPDKDNDNKFIWILLGYFKKIKYFPQGSGDIEYLKSLSVYKKNIDKFILMERDYDWFKSSLSGDLCFVGTRLHGGIMCMQHGLDSLVVAVDNRATEIGKDISLPVIKRGDEDNLVSWLDCKKIFNKVNLPIKEINLWKKQFK